MFYDKQLYTSILSNTVYYEGERPKHINPIVIKLNNGDFYVSKIREKDISIANGDFQTSKTVYEIEIEIAGQVIKEENLYFIPYMFFVPSTSGSKVYKWLTLEYGNILEMADLTDFFMIFQKQDLNSDDCLSSDYALYKNYTKVHEIKQARRIELKNKEIDISKIIFTRRRGQESFSSLSDNWLILEGKEYSETELGYTLPIWEATFSASNHKFSLTSMYSEENSLSVNSPYLLWNNKASTKWICPFGHKWESSVYNYTSGNYQYYEHKHLVCPECDKYLNSVSSSFPDESEYSFINMIKKGFQLYNTRSIKSLRERVIIDFNELLGLTEIGKIWIDKEHMPKYVSYYFMYPDGKHGDIDRYICDEFGRISQIDEFLFQGIIATENVDMLDIFEESYGTSNFDKYKEYLNNVDYKHFLTEHHVWFRLKFLSSLVKNFKNTGIDAFAFDRKLTQYRAGIRLKRNDFYSKVVAENKSTRKWVAEQTLYQRIKAAYPDAVFQYTAGWLGLQSLDIYIPSASVGIEYQGQQHYSPIELFGGEEGLKKRIALDEQKRIKCKENKVTLIEWKYDVLINDETVNLLLKDINILLKTQ